jgi:hypothetical protein
LPACPALRQTDTNNISQAADAQLSQAFSRQLTTDRKHPYLRD